MKDSDLLAELQQLMSGPEPPEVQEDEPVVSMSEHQSPLVGILEKVTGEISEISCRIDGLKAVLLELKSALVEAPQSDTPIEDK